MWDFFGESSLFGLILRSLLAFYGDLRWAITWGWRKNPLPSDFAGEYNLIDWWGTSDFSYEFLGDGDFYGDGDFWGDGDFFGVNFMMLLNGL